MHQGIFFLSDLQTDPLWMNWNILDSDYMNAVYLYCIWTCIMYLIIHCFWCSVAFSWYLYVKSTGYPYLERNNSCQEVQFTLGRDSWWRENRKYTSGVVFYVHILLTNYHISCTKQINSLVLFLLMCVRDMLCCLIIDRCILYLWSQ